MRGGSEEEEEKEEVAARWPSQTAANMRTIRRYLLASGPGPEAPGCDVCRWRRSRSGSALKWWRTLYSEKESDGFVVGLISVSVAQERKQNNEWSREEVLLVEEEEEVAVGAPAGRWKSPCAAVSCGSVESRARIAGCGVERQTGGLTLNTKS